MQTHRTDPKDIETLLLEHPDVKEAVVLAAGERLEAYVVADLASLRTSSSEETRLTDAGLIDRWNTLYEVTYSKGPEAPSFVGWTSSYTRQPIPEVQMEEWLQTTLQRIRGLKPQNVLEIGCGVGLLLQHLAPQCPLYVGTDFSVAALAKLKKWMAHGEDLKHVELLHRAASDLKDLQPCCVDTVVLNSVSQYFPNVEYFLNVLDGIRRLLRPGGKVFIGDVRNLQLLPTFHSAVQLSRAPDSFSADQLRRRVIRAISQETELALDPEFFQALPAQFPEFTAVDVQLRRGEAQNELTRYRYDVVLYTEDPHRDNARRQSVTWHTEAGFSPQIQRVLYARKWPALHVTAIPNRRVARDEAARELIHAGDERATAADLRQQLDNLRIDGVDPTELVQLGESQGYDVSIGWDLGKPANFFEARFLDRGLASQVPFCVSLPPQQARAWSEYANDPLENGMAQRLIPRLREHLKRQLPEDRIPPSWTVLKHLPRKPNGEVDRQVL